MRLASIELNNFRNIAAMQLNAVPGVNVIHGENAQGKTNIIEAIWPVSYTHLTLPTT